MVGELLPFGSASGVQQRNSAIRCQDAQVAVAKSREKIEAFIQQNNAQLWIQHDYTAAIKRKIAPAFYD